MRVLVADDDPTYLALLENLLTEWNYEVVLACDGNEAWSIMQAPDRPSLVILDWMMPGLDGFELARMIRCDPNSQGAYVLLVTGTRNRDDIMKVLVCGADDYLLKPFEPMDLKIHLRSATRILHLQEDLAELKRQVSVMST
jgi:DNA-binding response OmpR family regulator